MIGIKEIGAYVPPTRIDNRKQFPELDPKLVTEVLDIHQVARVGADESALMMCVKAFEELKKKIQTLPKIDLIVVAHQEIYKEIPQLSAQLHGYLNLDEDVECLDFGLGCTGFVHSLGLISSYMRDSGLKNALLINLEIMSSVLNKDDYATSLVFGDAATCALVGENPIFKNIGFLHGTKGAYKDYLKIDDRGLLFMDGKSIYDYLLRNVPRSVEEVLRKNNLAKPDIDIFLIHQANKRIVSRIAEQLELPPAKAPFVAQKYGNTGACSIPIMLQDLLRDMNYQKILLCSAGSGMAWSNAILERNI